MAGHSKWKTIKRKKEANDNKRSKVFSKMSRLITVAAKKGGGDVDANPALRLAVDRAKQARMPKDNIEKAIQKGIGGGEGSSFEEVTYEGFGVGGVAYLIYALTDNSNRTVTEMKTIFGKNNGSLGAPGSTAYIFDTENRVPTYTVEVDETALSSNERLQESLEDQDDVQDVYSNIQI